MSRIQQATPAPFPYNPQTIAVQTAGVLVSKVVMTVVDRVLYPEPKLSDLRDEMVKVIDENEPMVQEARAKRQVPRQSVGVPAEPAPVDVTAYIEQSLQALEQAQNATMCKVCKREIGEAARDVERRLATIRNTDRVYRSMQDLGTHGVIRPGIKWSTLTETERELVRQHARG